jgi:FMNH2-dependent dimethyl sulfone monooxygenase
MAETPASPLEFPDSPLARIMQQPLLLGLFLPIQSGGWSPSSLPRSTSWKFDYNARLTQRAEALGFDLAFGLAQWMGKGGTGGAIRFREQSLDPFITATSLAVITNRIILISTVHVLYGPWHPLYLAKLGATIDHICNGRWGLNVVTGFVPSEARMFGNAQIDHDQRYAMADEFTELMQALWASQENVSREGRYWRLIDAFVTPKPRFGRPLLVNATGSPAGIAYAAKHSDLVFITSPGGGRVDAAIAALAAADVEAIEGFLGRRASGDAKGWKTDLGAYRAVGGNMQIVGSPTQVVERFVQLKQAGCDGVQLTFFDFAEDLEFFGAQVLPLMRQAGLRK